MDFSFTFSYNTNRKLVATTFASDLSDFTEHTKTKSWSLKPNISYSFTNYITGNLFMEYGINESKTTGRKEVKDLGSSTNTKIQG